MTRQVEHGGEAGKQAIMGQVGQARRQALHGRGRQVDGTQRDRGRQVRMVWWSMVVRQT